MEEKPVPGKYLSRGGSSVVYLEQWNGKPAAFKRICEGDFNAKLYRNEVDILKILGSHSSIIQFLAYCNSSPHYLVFELGSELRYRLFCELGQPKILLPQRMQYAVHIAEGLIWIHGKNVIHRDVNLENVVLTNNEKCAKLVDFGVSVKLESGKSEYHNPDEKGWGTPGYKAPEVKEGIFSFKTDVFSFGVILYALVLNVDARKTNDKGGDYSVPTDFKETPTTQVSFIQSFWNSVPKNRPELKTALPEMKKLFAIK